MKNMGFNVLIMTVAFALASCGKGSETPAQDGQFNAATQDYRADLENMAGSAGPSASEMTAIDAATGNAQRMPADADPASLAAQAAAGEDAHETRRRPATIPDAPATTDMGQPAIGNNTTAPQLPPL